MKVAVVKPDHLGDFVLAAPAIRALVSHHGNATLYTASSTLPLARYLFPSLETLALDLPHLAKFHTGSTPPQQPIVDFRDYGRVYFLRQDQVFTSEWTQLMARRPFLVDDRQDTHETRLQAELLCDAGVAYDVPAGFLPRDPAPVEPSRVGLCISAGFCANRWPTLHWRALGRLLQARGVDVTVVCGPFETGEARLLASLLRLHPETGVLAGGRDFGAFLERTSALDLVVANDGGTAHICSLAVPVLSLFGGSPFRRFAPFGRYNRLITRELSCSPCCQYHEALINGCVTQECLSGIRPETVLRAVFEAPRGPGQRCALEDGCQLIWGVSHS